MLKSFACIVLLCAIPALAQDGPKSVAVTSTSVVPAADISKAFQKKCPNLIVIDDSTKSDFALEALKSKGQTLLGHVFDLTLLDHDGVTFRNVSDENLDNAIKELCRALKTEIAIEVVDTQNVTQSVDARGVSGGSGVLGAVGTVENATTGRRTHTDAATMAVIVNGEHALLDCYERAKGCVTIGPGKYYAELASDKRSLWVDHEIPISHLHVREHYVIAGSW